LAIRGIRDSDDTDSAQMGGLWTHPYNSRICRLWAGTGTRLCS